MTEEKMNTARYELSHPYLTMMGLYLGAFIGMFSETSLNIAIPVLTQQFELDTAVVQWLVTGYMLVIGLILPFAGLLMKWFPLKGLSLFALGTFLLGALISAFAPSFAILLLGRLVQGLGTGLILPLMFALVMEIFPPGSIGRAMGVTALIIMFAPAIGPTLSGFILAVLSWRWLFGLFALILLGALMFASKYLVSPYVLSRPPIDLLSCLASCLGFGGLVLGVGLAGEGGWRNPLVLPSLILGGCSMALYIYRQLNTERVVLNLRVFGLRDFSVGTILVMLNFGITLSAMYLFPQFIQKVLGLPVAVTGLLMLPGGIVNALVSVLAGSLYDRIGAVLMTRLGFAISTFGALMLLRADCSSSTTYIMASHTVLMIGVPLAMSPAQSSALNALPRGMSADGSTILNTLQQVVGAICTAVTTLVLSFGQQRALSGGPDNPTAAFARGVHDGFGFTLILALVGLGLALLARRKQTS